MCEFHSFLWTEEGEAIEFPGVVHHSEIAHLAGVTSRAMDQFLKPEFDIVQRRLRWDEEPEPGIFTQRALRRLEWYLRARFDTPENLVKFVEDGYWKVARRQLLRLVYGAGKLLGAVCTESCAIPVWKAECHSWGSDEVTGWEGVLVMATYESMAMLDAEKFELELGGTPILRGVVAGYTCDYGQSEGEVRLRIHFLNGERPASIGALTPNEDKLRLRIYRIPKKEKLFDQWAAAFLDKRRRAPQWNYPLDIDYAIGLKNRPAYAEEVASC